MIKKIKNKVGRLLKNNKLLAKTPQTTESGTCSLPDWDKFVKNSALWENSLITSQNGKPVLIATSVGGLSAATILESLLGVALTLRGARPHFLLCDGVLPACLHIHIGKVKGSAVISDYRLQKEVCPGCLTRGKSIYKGTGLPISYYSEYISETKRAELRQLANSIDKDAIGSYTLHRVAIGEHARAGALRFFACGNLPDTVEAEKVLRRYFESALITETVIQTIQHKHKFESAVFHHGIYVPQGIIGEVARANHVRVSNWQVAYRKKCFIFSHNETYHHTLISEPTASWENVSWNQQLTNKTLDYLKSRWYGSNDWIWFHDQPKHAANDIAQETGLDFSKPVITLLTNVYWDAQLHFKANAFKDMLDWLLQTIHYFTNRPDLQLAIRIHPAEVRGAIPSRQPIVTEIANAYPDLPHNICIIPPESQISTYVLCENSDAAIIYGTKTGVELTAMGIPVIVAGEAWIRGKGLTEDATSPENYFSLLDKLPYGQRLSEQQRNRAMKYAFHFFFRRFIPINFMQPCTQNVPYEIMIHGLEDLLPGRDAGLDVLCNGILEGSEYIYPAETLGEDDETTLGSCLCERGSI